MANMAARSISSEVKQAPYVGYGGFATTETSKSEGPDFTGPAWFTDAMKNVY